MVLTFSSKTHLYKMEEALLKEYYIFVLAEPPKNPGEQASMQKKRTVGKALKGFMSGIGKVFSPSKLPRIVPKDRKGQTGGIFASFLPAEKEAAKTDFPPRAPPLLRSASDEMAQPLFDPHQV